MAFYTKGKQQEQQYGPRFDTDVGTCLMQVSVDELNAFFANNFAGIPLQQSQESWGAEGIYHTYRLGTKLVGMYKRVENGIDAWINSEVVTPEEVKYKPKINPYQYNVPIPFADLEDKIGRLIGVKTAGTIIDPLA